MFAILSKIRYAIANQRGQDLELKMNDRHWQPTQVGFVRVDAVSTALNPDALLF